MDRFLRLPFDLYVPGINTSPSALNSLDKTHYARRLSWGAAGIRREYHRLVAEMVDTARRQPSHLSLELSHEGRRKAAVLVGCSAWLGRD